MIVRMTSPTTYPACISGFLLLLWTCAAVQQSQVARDGRSIVVASLSRAQGGVLPNDRYVAGTLTAAPRSRDFDEKQVSSQASGKESLLAEMRFLVDHPEELDGRTVPAHLAAMLSALGQQQSSQQSLVDEATFISSAAAPITGAVPVTALVMAEGGEKAARLTLESSAASAATNAVHSSASDAGKGATDSQKGAQEPGTFADFLGVDIQNLDTRHLVWTPWALAFTATVGAFCFEVVHRRFAGTDLTLPLEYGKEEHVRQLCRLFQGVWALVRPYVWEQENRQSWYYFGALVVLGLIELALGLVLTVWSKNFWDTIEKKKVDHFMPLMQNFTLLVFTIILVRTYAGYIGMMLVINWRRFMTDWLLEKWLANKSFYRLQLQNGAAPDNPDQRIQEDIAMFIEAFMSLASGFFESVGRIVSMLPVLLVLSPDYAFGVFYCPGWLLYLSIIYSGAGALFAHWVGGQLILINFARQKYEASFRYRIVQIRDNAESIALWGSEGVENSQMKDSFDWVVRVWWLIMLYTKRLGFFTSFYMQTSMTFPYLVLAPSYFKGQISLGTMFMLFNALGSVKGGFDWFLMSYTTVTSFRATIDRLQNFISAIDTCKKDVSEIKLLSEPPPEAPGAAVMAKGVSVRLPGPKGRSLWQSAGLTIGPGDFVLLSAPEGSGKSCFFRALAGIWPFCDGEAYLPEDALFVPQRSYVPQGSLKQAVCYPSGIAGFGDDEVMAALREVGLTAVADKSLQEEANWALVLSGGEQQKLSMARVLLRKPSVLFLDEATSAIGEDGTLEVYRLLRREGSLPKGASVVSVSHEVQLLRPVHDKHYTYDVAKGVWQAAAATKS